MAAPPVTSKSVSLSSSKVLFRFLLPVSLLVLYSYLAFHHRSLSEGLFFASTSKLSQAPLYQSIKAGPLSAVIGKPTFQLFENWSQKILTTTVVLPQTQTLVLFVVLYLLYGFCYTAGYHRLWAHQSFSANFILRLVFAFGGAGNFNGTILNWSRNHRAHHRHIDCEQDPFNINQGLFYSAFSSHLSKIEKVGTADVTDLKKDWVVTLQKITYLPLALFSGWILPAIIASQWNDTLNGFFIAGVLRALLFTQLQNITQALGRIFGKRPYSERTSARNNALLSILSVGENYLNYHYEFPKDYRLGCRAFHFDVTKWAIYILSFTGFVYNLNTTPLKESLLLRIQMKQERLDKMKKTVVYGPEEADLPFMTASELKSRVAKGELLVTMDRLVLDLSTFISKHPGGEAIITPKIGKDITIAFNGGVQRHSKAARNLAALLRVARLAANDQVVADDSL